MSKLEFWQLELKAANTAEHGHACAAIGYKVVLRTGSEQMTHTGDLLLAIILF